MTDSEDGLERLSVAGWGAGNTRYFFDSGGKSARWACVGVVGQADSWRVWYVRG